MTFARCPCPLQVMASASPLLDRICTDGLDDDLISMVLARVSPFDRSPYLLRCVCRSFRGFYKLPGVWTNLLRDHFSTDESPDVLVEGARWHCNLALQEPWAKIINGQVLNAFRASGWTRLVLSRAEMTSLPEQYGELSNLEDLDLSQCRYLRSLPEGFGDLKSLTSLNLRECRSLVSLSEGFGELINLQTLGLQCKSLKSLPERFGDLKSLTSLNLRDCYSLVSLSAGFGKLKSLTFLSLWDCRSLVSLSEGFGELKSLKKLIMYSCPAASSMPAALKEQLKGQGCESKGW